MPLASILQQNVLERRRTPGPVRGVFPVVVGEAVAPRTILVRERREDPLGVLAALLAEGGITEAEFTLLAHHW